jgi:putative ABC transport system permease protein
MTGLTQDIWYALRQLRKAPVFALTAVITLALGIGANTAIFTVFNQVLLRMLPVEKPHELVQVTYIGSDRGRILVFGGEMTMYFSNPMYRDLQSKSTVFSGMLADVEASVGLVWKGESEVADTEVVSGNYFQVLGVRAAQGRTLLESDDQVKNGSPVAVLSYAYWKTRFAGSPDVVNKTVLVNGQPFTIVGVAAPGFSSAISGFKPKIFVPITMESVVMPGRDDLSDRRSRWLNIVARLKPGVSAATAQAQMTVLWKQLRANELTAMSNRSESFTDRFVAKSSIVLLDNSKGFSPLRDSLKTPLMILMGMVLLLAAMTCMNLTSLLLVRGAARGKEFAVRYALGAARGRIVRQLLVEGVLLGGIGGVLGLALAPVAAELLVRRVTATTGEIAFSTRPDAWVLGFNLLLSLGISVLFSLAPAWQMMKPDMTDGLRQKSATNLGAAQRFRTVAIGLQIGLSVLLLSGAGLFVRTLHQLKAQPTGMATDHLVEFSLDPTMSGFQTADLGAVHKRMTAALMELPGVTAAGGTTDPVLSGNEWDTGVTVEGYTPPPDSGTSIEIANVTPGYFSTLQIPLLGGRIFSDADHDGTAQVAVVNRKFAVKYFGSADKALGHFLSTGAPTAKLDTQIVGVVEDTKHHGLRDGLIPILYEPYAQNATSWNSLEYYVRTTQPPEQAESMVRAAVHRVDPKLVPDGIETMDEQIDSNVSNESMIAMLAACFAMIALLTTAVGLYGVLAYATEQRTHEIGIRMALGAQRIGIVRLVLWDMARVAAIAVVIALPVSVAISRLLQSQLFEVSPFDPLTLCVCAIVTIGMVALAAAVPARRAASVQPMQALRTE